jgi:hypothetical protein
VNTHARRRLVKIPFHGWRKNMSQTAAATSVSDVIPPSSNGGTTVPAQKQPFTAMPASAIVDPKSPQSLKLQEWHDLSADITKDDLEIEKIKNDLKSARGRREQKVKKLLELGLEPTMPIPFEQMKHRKPDLFDQPEWARQLSPDQRRGVAEALNEARRAAKREPLALRRDPKTSILQLSLNPGDSGEPAQAIDIAQDGKHAPGIQWKGRQLKKSEVVFDWSSGAPATTADEAEEKAAFELATLKELNVPEGMAEKLEADGIKTGKELQAWFAEHPPRKIAGVGDSAREKLNDLMAAFYEKRRAMVAEAALSADSPPEASTGEATIRRVVAREVGLTYQELAEVVGLTVTTLAQSKGSKPPALRAVMVGVQQYVVADWKEDRSGGFDFALLPVFPADDYTGSKHQQAAQVIDTYKATIGKNPDSLLESDFLAGVEITVNRKLMCIGKADSGALIVTAREPEKRKAK